MAEQSNIFPPIKVAGNHFVIKCVEFLDASNSAHFSEVLTNCINEGNVKIVLDFSELLYIASAGANVIIGKLEHVRNIGGDLVILQPTENVQEVIDLLGLSTLLQIALEPASAARYFRDMAERQEAEKAEKEKEEKENKKVEDDDIDIDELKIPDEDLLVPDEDPLPSGDETGKSKPSGDADKSDAS